MTRLVYNSLGGEAGGIQVGDAVESLLFQQQAQQGLYPRQQDRLVEIHEPGVQGNRGASDADVPNALIHGCFVPSTVFLYWLV